VNATATAGRGAPNPSRAARPFRLAVALPLGRAAAALSRRLVHGEGRVIGGRVCLAIDRDAVAHLLAGHPRVAFVSGTNGKTTTTALLAAAAARAGGPIVTNTQGANLPSGIVSALADAEPNALALLEVDERYLPQVVAVAHDPVTLLLNLSRDQLDRMNEVRDIAARWRHALEGGTGAVIANADDPIVAYAAPPARTVWVAAGTKWRGDARSCPACTSRLEYAGENWNCTSCDFRRPAPDVILGESDVTLASGARVRLPNALPGAHARANAAFALAALEALGVPLEGATDAMESIADVDGRYQRVWGAGHEGRLYLGKNPAGWEELLDVIAEPVRPVAIAINANDPDGRDPSWLWDVPFERLRGRPVLATGERCRDLAVRLRYAEVDHDVEPDLERAITWARARDADVVATYSAFQRLKKELRGGD
jgi:UDP-N-acetylmuramyl tripeptide synthase